MGESAKLLDKTLQGLASLVLTGNTSQSVDERVRLAYLQATLGQVGADVLLDMLVEKGVLDRYDVQKRLAAKFQESAQKLGGKVILPTTFNGARRG